MKPNCQSSGAAVCCDVAAFGTAEFNGGELGALRQKPGPARRLPPALLRHSDEQTVACVTAVWQALERYNLADADFSDWGVIAAPRYLGRSEMANAVAKYAAEGAWGISPHLIPHRSLHSISGTISQALGIHGPNFGIGGGSEAAGEIFLSVSTLLERERLPGLWLVMSGWDQEPAPKPDASSTCGAVALALVTESSGAATGRRLRILPAVGEDRSSGKSPLTLEALRTALARSVFPPLPWSWRLPGGVCVELAYAAMDQRLAA